ncbi:hypothetical protein Syun_009567 [Stephania yunnanensis]|uniref:Uncharacterized protein n=1 Tax=Stephania yunnanensis TaxID=152371 RepID=A0AAP0KER6_9MAGN
MDLDFSVDVIYVIQLYWKTEIQCSGNYVTSNNVDFELLTKSQEDALFGAIGSIDTM